MLNVVLANRSALSTFLFRPLTRCTFPSIVTLSLAYVCVLGTCGMSGTSGLCFLHRHASSSRFIGLPHRHAFSSSRFLIVTLPHHTSVIPARPHSLLFALISTCLLSTHLCFLGRVNISLLPHSLLRHSSASVHVVCWFSRTHLRFLGLCACVYFLTLCFLTRLPVCTLRVGFQELILALATRRSSHGGVGIAVSKVLRHPLLRSLLGRFYFLQGCTL